MMMKETKEAIGLKKQLLSNDLKTQLGYYLMLFIPMLWIFLFGYCTLLGNGFAFIDYKPAKGFFGSEFIGLRNFINFFKSTYSFRVIRNTVFYNLTFLILIKCGGGLFHALVLYEIRSKLANKFFHTCMLFPSFIALTVYSAILLMFTSPDTGMINKLLEFFGKETVNVYVIPKLWPIIIVCVRWIISAGTSSLMFYAALLSIDTELFDVAKLDGANRLQQIRYISLPAMSKVFCLTLVLGLGDTFASGISPMYELSLNTGVLYETTETLGIYMMNGIKNGRYSFTVAVSFAQGLIGVLLTFAANLVVKKVDPESAVF